MHINRIFARSIVAFCREKIKSAKEKYRKQRKLNGFFVGYDKRKNKMQDKLQNNMKKYAKFKKSFANLCASCGHMYK